MKSTTTAPTTREDTRLTTLGLTSEEFVAMKFPSQKGEVRRDIRPVGTNRWRVNFWGKKKIDGCLSNDIVIIRSVYVACTKTDNGSWDYEVFTD